MKELSIEEKVKRLEITTKNCDSIVQYRDV